jgi:octanoyl-[GcvH]:protein N-octanoyltransferase
MGGTTAPIGSLVDAVVCRRHNAATFDRVIGYMDILRCSRPSEPARDMAVTAALLQSVAGHRSPPTVRIFRPGSTVAFGKRDSFQSGFERASESALRHGFEPVVRQAGGHAVAYDGESVVVEFVRPEHQLLGGLELRFIQLATLISATLAELGLVLELGELPGEHCPGRFSLHLPGGPKVAGIAQRVIKGASLTTGVIAVGHSQRIRAVTSEVYADLDLPLDLRTVGALADRWPSITASEVADTLAELALGQLESSEDP